ncbi:hypothetical protein EDC04DRAFT_2213510 [Pisolithus marmoratus]|nr:hypothetical protein EDC04DRAFT_2213510 [Pisolithus marmoratus]
MYQIFYGTQGLRKHQVIIVSAAIIEFVVEFTVGVEVAAWVGKRIIEPPAGIPWPGCMLSEAVNDVLTLPSWIVASLVATIFLGLALRLLYSSMRWRFGRFKDFTVSNIKEEIRNIQPMTIVLVRDSVLFYVPMFGILTASVPVMVIYRTEIVAGASVPIILAVYSFCASRLIIHTREGFVRSSHDGPSGEVEPINFASRSLMTSHAGTRTGQIDQA